ncbi:nickel import ATP-binding protein NikE [Camelimonas sp. ID_303_24]
MSLIAAHGISRVYRNGLLGRGGKTALDQVSLDIAPGECVALLGRSGCGKSTLARLLAGLERPDAGEVRFAGRALSTFGRADWRAFRRAVQLVFQDPVGAVNPRETVSQIIAEPLRHLRGLSGDAATTQIQALLRAVDFPADATDRLPQQLSGGQLQRVCVARALAAEPQLLILDEAVSNLDLHLQIRMLDLFARLKRERGVGYLFITHDLRLAERFCDRVLVMDDGRLVEETRVGGAFALTSREGRALQDAILPAMPSRRARAG